MSRHHHKSDSSMSPSNNPSTDTCNEILSACNDCDRSGCDRKSCTRVTGISRVEFCPPSHIPNRQFDAGATNFTSVVTPLTNVMPMHSGCTGCVQFTMRRKNKTVTLQWEPFTGNMAASGVAFLTVVQSICNTPPFPISIPIYLEYKSVGRVTHVDIDPNAKNGNIRFYLNTDGSATGVTIGDAVFVHGGSATWIVEC